MKINELFGQKLAVVNDGVERFYDAVMLQGADAVQVDYKPKAGGDEKLLALLDRLPAEKCNAANQKALDIINRGEPELVDICYAHEVIPDMTANTIGHAGPALPWEKMCGPMQGAVIGAIRYERLAATEEEALRLIQEGGIRFTTDHDMGCVGPMTGMITWHMPLFVVRNKTFGNTAYCTFNEGLGKVLRFGANDDTVIDRLRWLESVLAPAMKKALQQFGPIPLRVIMAKALSMGDEMHQRNIAASSVFAREIMPRLVRVEQDPEKLAQITDFVTGNDQFFLNLAMASGKAIMDPVKNIPHCTVVTAMSRNGTNFGIRVSALGDQWFEAPCLMPEGLYFPGYSAEDANPDMGDSAITESMGIGGFAMGSAPAVVRFVGAGTSEDAMRYSDEMRKITVGRSTSLIMPPMNFIGTPTGIDIRRVVETGITPVINTGIAHKKAGIGQIGAGVVRAPADCFIQALRAFAQQEGTEDI